MTIEVRQMVIKSAVEEGAARAMPLENGEAREVAPHTPGEASGSISLAMMRAIVDHLDRMRER